MVGTIEIVGTVTV